MKAIPNLTEFNINFQEQWNLAQSIIQNLYTFCEVTKTNRPVWKDSFFLSSAMNFELYICQKLKKENRSFKLCLIKRDNIYMPNGRKRSDNSFPKESHLYFWGVLDLKKDIGDVLIRPETLADKIAEWFEPIEVDFDSAKKFSRKYYVLSSSRMNVQNTIPNGMLDFFGKYEWFRNRN